MLKIDNLRATVDGKAIQKGFSLTLNPAETHPITEPDGASRRSDSVRFPPIAAISCLRTLLLFVGWTSSGLVRSCRTLSH